MSIVSKTRVQTDGYAWVKRVISVLQLRFEVGTPERGAVLPDMSGLSAVVAPPVGAKRDDGVTAGEGSSARATLFKVINELLLHASAVLVTIVVIIAGVEV